MAFEDNLRQNIDELYNEKVSFGEDPEDAMYD